jgi:hypothetical protein
MFADGNASKRDDRRGDQEKEEIGKLCIVICKSKPGTARRVRKRRSIPNPSDKAQTHQQKNRAEIDGSEEVIELQDGGDDRDASPERIPKREAMESWKERSEEKRAGTDADSGAQEPGEKDAKDDQCRHRSEILAGLRVE